MSRIRTSWYTHWDNGTLHVKLASQLLIDRHNSNLLISILVSLNGVPKGHIYWLKICDTAEILISYLKLCDMQLYNGLGEEVLRYIIRANLLCFSSEFVWFHDLHTNTSFDVHRIMEIKARGADTM